VESKTKEFIQKHYSPKRDWVEKGSGLSFPKRYRHYNIGVAIPKGFKGVKMARAFEIKLKALLIEFDCDFIEIEDFKD